MQWIFRVQRAEGQHEYWEEPKKNPPKKRSSTVGSEVARPPASFPIVDLKDYNIVKKTIYYVQLNHMIEKRKIVSTESEKILKKIEFHFMMHSKTLIHKTSVYPKLLQLKICSRKNKKKRAPEKFSPIFTKLTERFVLLIAVDKIVLPEELKKQVVDATYFGHPGSTKMLAEANIFWWAGMRNDREEKCSTWTVSVSPGRISKYQSPMTEKSTGIDRTGTWNTTRFSWQIT